MIHHLIDMAKLNFLLILKNKNWWTLTSAHVIRGAPGLLIIDSSLLGEIERGQGMQSLEGRERSTGGRRLDHKVTGAWSASMAAAAGDHSHRGEAAEGDEEEERAQGEGQNGG